MRGCDHFIVGIRNPTIERKTCSDGRIEAAADAQDGARVVLRSTVEAGTTRHTASPILAASGKRFDVAMCPEHTRDGVALPEL